jgi:site-specific DNA recombinase
LETAGALAPELPSMADADLLDAVPYLTLNLAHAPESLLRRLFEIIHLQVQSHLECDDVTLTITLPGDMVPDLAEAAERIEETMPVTHRLPVAEGQQSVQMLTVPPTGFEPVLPP